MSGGVQPRRPFFVRNTVIQKSVIEFVASSSTTTTLHIPRNTHLKSDRAARQRCRSARNDQRKRPSKCCLAIRYRSPNRPMGAEAAASLKLRIECRESRNERRGRVSSPPISLLSKPFQRRLLHLPAISHYRTARCGGASPNQKKKKKDEGEPGEVHTHRTHCVAEFARIQPKLISDSLLPAPKTRAGQP